MKANDIKGYAVTVVAFGAFSYLLAELTFRILRLFGVFK